MSVDKWHILTHVLEVIEAIFQCPSKKEVIKQNRTQSRQGCGSGVKLLLPLSIISLIFSFISYLNIFFWNFYSFIFFLWISACCFGSAITLIFYRRCALNETLS